MSYSLPASAEKIENIKCLGQWCFSVIYILLDSLPRYWSCIILYTLGPVSILLARRNLVASVIQQSLIFKSLVPCVLYKNQYGEKIWRY